MLRRDFLALAAAQTLFPRTGKESFNPRDFGWIPGSKSTDLKTVHLYGFGKGKVSCLWKPWKKVTGKELTPRKQAYKDCVAVASAAALDILTILQIAQGRNERWITKSAADPIYAGGRNNIVHGKVKHGMQGIWAVKYLKKYGNLLMQKYGEHDFTEYSEDTSSYWEDRKLPESLLQDAKLHPLLDYAAVRTWSEIRDAVAAGYPILYCSDMGADDSRRDSQGFMTPKGEWYHAWCIIGVDDTDRPGACLLNSHGRNWGSGPKTHNQPDGSVWIDKKVIIKSILGGEAYAFSSYKGFPMPKREYILW